MIKKINSGTETKTFNNKQDGGGASKTRKLKPLLISNATIDQELTSPIPTLRVLLRLLDHYNHKKYLCCPSIEWLAEVLGVCERSVERAIAQLVSTNWLSIEERNGHFRYHFNWSKAIPVDLRNPRDDENHDFQNQKRIEQNQKRIEKSEFGNADKSGTSGDDFAQPVGDVDQPVENVDQPVENVDQPVGTLPSDLS